MDYENGINTRFPKLLDYVNWSFFEFELNFTDHNFIPHLKRFSLLNICDLHIYYNSITAYKIDHKLFLSPPLVAWFTNRELTYNIRNPRIVYEGINKTEFSFGSNSSRLGRLWNQIDTVIRNVPSSQFKSMTTNQLFSDVIHLLSHYYLILRKNSASFFLYQSYLMCTLASTEAHCHYYFLSKSDLL